jgi:hypothetical protein
MNQNCKLPSGEERLPNKILKPHSGAKVECRSQLKARDKAQLETIIQLKDPTFNK